MENGTIEKFGAVYVQDAEEHNIEYFKQGQTNGYVCKLCGNPITLEKSFSNEGKRLTCVRCASREAKQKGMNIGDWVAEYIFSSNLLEKECNEKIISLAKEIVNTLRKYDPNASYINICLCLCADTLSINNNYWESPFQVKHSEEVK